MTDYQSALDKAKAIAAKLVSDGPNPTPSSNATKRGPEDHEETNEQDTSYKKTKLDQPLGAAEEGSTTAAISPKSSSYQMFENDGLENSKPVSYNKRDVSPLAKSPTRLEQQQVMEGDTQQGELEGGSASTYVVAEQERTTDDQSSYDPNGPSYQQQQEADGANRFESKKPELRFDYSSAPTEGEVSAANLHTEEMIVPKRVVGLIIGRGGETLKKIYREHNVKVNVNDDPRSPADRIVSLIGEPNDINNVKQFVESIVAEDNQGTKMEVPSFKVGLLIGRGGDTIQNIQMKSGAKVNVDRGSPHDRSPTRLVVLTGTSEAIEAAQKMIQEILDSDPRDQQQHHDSGGMGGSYGGAGGQQNYNNYGYGGHTGGNSGRYVTELVFVPNDKVGLIIGRGGDTIKKLKSEHRIRIFVDPNPTPQGRKVTIQGFPDSIQRAKMAIGRITSRPHDAYHQTMFSQQQQGYQGYDMYGQQQAGYSADQYAAYGGQQYAQGGYDPSQYSQTYPGQASAASTANPAASSAGGYDQSQYADYYAQYANDPNYAQWYAQYYPQGGNPGTANTQEQDKTTQ